MKRKGLAKLTSVWKYLVAQWPRQDMQAMSLIASAAFAIEHDEEPVF